MSRTRRRPAGNQGERPWIPMQPATQIIPPELAALAAKDPDVAATILSGKEVWRNDRYICHVRRRPEDGSVYSLSIRRADRKAVWDWRHLQMIKNEIAGPETDAFQRHPPWSQTVDTANQYWIWCLRPGDRIEVGIGNNERDVAGEPDPEVPLSQQRPFAEGERL